MYYVLLQVQFTRWEGALANPEIVSMQMNGVAPAHVVLLLIGQIGVASSTDPVRASTIYLALLHVQQVGGRTRLS